MPLPPTPKRGPRSLAGFTGPLHKLTPARQQQKVAGREAPGQRDPWGAFVVDDNGFALGRYQMRTQALVDAGMLRGLPNEPGERQEYEWTGKYGVNGWRDFVNNHDA